MIQFTSSIGGHTVQLRNPELGNVLSPILIADYKRSISGLRYSYVKKPIRFRHRLNISALSYEKAKQLVLVIEHSLKQHAVYVDWLNQSWKVNFVEPDITISEINICKTSISLEFVGVKI